MRWGAKDKRGTFRGQKWQIIYREEGGVEDNAGVCGLSKQVGGGDLDQEETCGLVPEADLARQVWGI